MSRFLTTIPSNTGIVNLGLVGNITIKDSNVAVTLEVPVHRGASMEPIRKLAQQNILRIS